MSRPNWSMVVRGAGGRHPDPQRRSCILCPVCRSREIYEHHGEFAERCEECEKEE